MVRPKFELKVKNRVSVCEKPNSKAEAVVKRKEIEQKELQVSDAVSWCETNFKRGHAALKTGMFPLIKDRGTIDRRLNGKHKNHKKEHLRILTPEEESSIVEFIKNKNRCHQGITRKHITSLIIDVLKIRHHCNTKKKGGRRYVRLSANAKRVLTTKKLGQSFWQRWEAEHKDLVLKRQGNVAMNRALNCTREMAETHLDALAEELIICGIFINAKKIESGVWTGETDTRRVFNHDEVPQFINYGVDATVSGLAYAAKGESCKKMIRENRESVTINPVVSLDGEIVVSQVLFSGKGITSQMVPKVAAEKMENLIISATEKGSQDNNSLLDVYKRFDKYLNEKQIQRPVVMLADGHGSRFDYKVLHFLREKNIHLFVSPPDTTGVTQLLDQSPNQNLHREYNKKRDELFTPFQPINREGFMTILAQIWDKWASKETIENAAKRVGITRHGLNVNNMQQDKFEQAANCMTNNQVTANGSIPTTPTKVTTRSSTTATKPMTPRSMAEVAKTQHRYGSSDYWKFMFEQSQSLIKDSYEKSLHLNKIPGLLSIRKVKPKDLAKKSNTKITSVHGSMEAQAILEKVESVEADKEKKQKQKEQRQNDKVKRRELFYKCKSKCICKGVCEAKGLKECPVCHEIKKSICSKAVCRMDGVKPLMLTTETSTSKKPKYNTLSDEEELEENDM